MGTVAGELAAFVQRASYEQISDEAREQLKLRVMDSLGCAIGALDGEPIGRIRRHLDEFAGAPLCGLIGGGRSTPDRAALYNSALVRYLDYNDSYIARGETCHPSDNLGAVLAASEYARGSGRDLLVALAVAYQVQCRLSDAAPVRAKGFDHTVQGTYALAGAISKALGLDAARTANAIGICGTAFNALRVTRTGPISQWKGLAYPQTAFACMQATFLARSGITGPLDVFEGNKGFIDTIAGPFAIDWSREDLERVTRTSIKKYNAEFHSQSAVDGILELVREHGFNGEQVQRIDIDIFDVAYHIIGGGEEGVKTVVTTKEQADHSLPYMIAAAVLDGELGPAQYIPDRIIQPGVQKLLRRVHVRPDEELSRRFPAEMPCRLKVALKDGRVLVKDKRDYEGFFTRPMTRAQVARKFRLLCDPHIGGGLQEEILAAVETLEGIEVGQLTAILNRARSRRQDR